MISDKARELLSQPMAGDARDNPPAVSFSDHKGDSCVTRVFRSNYSNDATDCARRRLELARSECKSIASPLNVMMFPFVSAAQGSDNVVAVVSAYDLVAKDEID